VTAAADVLDEIEELNDVARVRLGQARLAQAAGDTARSTALFTSAVRILHSLGTTDELARAPERRWIRARAARAADHGQRYIPPPAP
jgi:hypothetical protein